MKNITFVSVLTLFYVQSAGASKFEYCGFFGKGFVAITSQNLALDHIRSAIQFQSQLGESENVRKYGFPEITPQLSKTKLDALNELLMFANRSFTNDKIKIIIQRLNTISGLYHFQFALNEGSGSWSILEVAQGISGPALRFFVKEKIELLCPEDPGRTVQN